MRHLVTGSPAIPCQSRFPAGATARICGGLTALCRLEGCGRSGCPPRCCFCVFARLAFSLLLLFLSFTLIIFFSSCPSPPRQALSRCAVVSCYVSWPQSCRGAGRGSKQARFQLPSGSVAELVGDVGRPLVFGACISRHACQRIKWWPSAPSEAPNSLSPITDHPPPLLVRHLYLANIFGADHPGWIDLATQNPETPSTGWLLQPSPTGSSGHRIILAPSRTQAGALSLSATTRYRLLLTCLGAPYLATSRRLFTWLCPPSVFCSPHCSPGPSHSPLPIQNKGYISSHMPRRNQSKVASPTQTAASASTHTQQIGCAHPNRRRGYPSDDSPAQRMPNLAWTRREA